MGVAAPVRRPEVRRGVLGAARAPGRPARPGRHHQLPLRAVRPGVQLHAGRLGAAAAALDKVLEAGALGLAGGRVVGEVAAGRAGAGGLLEKGENRIVVVEAVEHVTSNLQ